MISTSALRSRMERTTRVGVLARLIRLVLAVLLSSLAALLLVTVSSLLGQLLVGSGSRRTTHVLKVGSRLGCDRLMLREGIVEAIVMLSAGRFNKPALASQCKPPHCQPDPSGTTCLSAASAPEQRLASEVVCVAHADVCGHHCSDQVAL